jgi:hypothetical protein
MAKTQRVILKVECDVRHRGCEGSARSSEKTVSEAHKRLAYLGWEVSTKNNRAVCSKCKEKKK